MSLFLNQMQLYRLIQRELPEDVYPDAGDPTAYWSTADSASEAGILANLYERYSEMWDDYWPQTASLEGIAKHEIAHFGDLSTGLTLQERRDRIVEKMRSLPSLSVADLEAIVAAELPDDVDFKIIEWGCSEPGVTWLIGESELGISTILGGYGASLYPIGTDLCTKDGSDVGMTAEEWENYQISAYTYEVLIFDTTPSDAVLAAIDRALTRAEPARSRHIISTNVDPDLYP